MKLVHAVTVLVVLASAAFGQGGEAPAQPSGLAPFEGKYVLMTAEVIPGETPEYGCSLVIEIIAQSNALTVHSRGGEPGRWWPTTLPAINGQRYCEELNSSYMFGGWRCWRTTLAAQTIESRSCQTNSRFMGRCTPDENPIRIELVDDDELLYDESCVGYCPKRLICRYRRVPSVTKSI